MKRYLLAGALAVLGVACNPSIPNVPAPTNTIVAVFNPGNTPPQVPTPNALATDPATGLLNVPNSGPGYSAADTDFANYLNTLDGFPADTPASAQFTGALAAASVGASSVKVLDVTAAPSPVAVGTVYANNQITIAPTSGTWTSGHTYAIVLIGGQNATGLKGAASETVIGSQTWFLVRENTSLVTCTDLASSSCAPTTNLIPTAAQAVQLEQIRLGYKPILDAVVAGGATRSDIVLAWTFKIVDFTTLAFNPAAVPPVVPAPNDLAVNKTGSPDGGPIVAVPVDPASPAAQQEFLTTYLNTLNGFPAETPASTTVIGGNLDPTSVTTGGATPSVIVADLTTVADGGTAVPTVATYDSTAAAISITPPGGWQHGHQYAIAVLTGSGGVQATGGKPVVGTDIWALVRSADPLVAAGCTGPTNCQSALSLVPLSSSQAFQLEQLRQGYQPIIDGLGLNRQNLSLLWTFTVVSNLEVTFNPAASVIPFPNDLLLSAGRVNLPIPDGGSPLLGAIIAGLDTLDGFSTTTPIISENSDPVGVLDQGNLDPASLAVPGTTGFFPVTTVSLPPRVTTCINCASSLLADGGVQPVQQLQFVPTVPLQEKSTYGAYVSTNVVDTNGQPVISTVPFTLLRLTNPLVDGSGHATVQGVSDAQAAQLEQIRLAYKPLLDGLSLQGLPRTSVALAWTFTTQSTQTPLGQLHGIPAALGAAGALPSTPVFAADISAIFPWGPIPHSHVNKIFSGELQEDFLLTGPGGTINPAGAPTLQRVPFLLTEPKGTAPVTGWPVVIFGHGLTRSKNDVAAIADALSQAGFAAIATDVVWHGDRSSCTGVAAGAGLPSDDAACALPASQKCNEATPIGRCVARGTASTCSAACTTAGLPPGTPADLCCSAIGQGACLSTASCEGGTFLTGADGTVAISGWNILNLTNFFATRDNFREQVPDLAQVARVVSDTTNATSNLNFFLVAQGGAALDGTKIQYTGQSLGGILGTLYTSVAPEVHRAVLNVPGADLPSILLTSPAFATQKGEFEAVLGSQGIFPGSPAFDQFIGIAKWVLDPADPGNAAYALRHGVGPVDRNILLQYIQSDEVIPNPATAELIAAANQTPADPKAINVCEFTDANCPAGGPCILPPVGHRHGFLLQGLTTATAFAQGDDALFLAGGSPTCP